MYNHLFITFSLPTFIQCYQIDVLKISNVPFPNSGCCKPNHYSAVVNAPFDTDIPEFTVCYRMLINSYNERDFLHLGQLKMAMDIILIFWIECVGNVEEDLKDIKVD